MGLQSSAPRFILPATTTHVMCGCNANRRAKHKRSTQPPDSNPSDPPTPTYTPKVNTDALTRDLFATLEFNARHVVDSSYSWNDERNTRVKSAARTGDRSRSMRSETRLHPRVPNRRLRRPPDRRRRLRRTRTCQQTTRHRAPASNRLRHTNRGVRVVRALRRRMPGSGDHPHTAPTEVPLTIDVRPITPDRLEPAWHRTTVTAPSDPMSSSPSRQNQRLIPTADESSPTGQVKPV